MWDQLRIKIYNINVRLRRDVWDQLRIKIYNINVRLRRHVWDQLRIKTKENELLFLIWVSLVNLYLLR